MPVDLRFFEALGTFTVQELAELTGAKLIGDPEILIDGIASVEDAKAQDLCFFEGKVKALSEA